MTSLGLKNMSNTKHFSVFSSLMVLYVGTKKQKSLCFELLELIIISRHFVQLNFVVSADGSSLDFLLDTFLTLLYGSLNLPYLSIIPP